MAQQHIGKHVFGCHTGDGIIDGRVAIDMGSVVT
jgi:hypothetical protein